MKIPCAHGALIRWALFCPATAAVCLGKTFWDSKLTAWIRLRHAGRFTPSCAHETACVRARTQYVAQTIVPSSSHRYDVPEVEFKKNSIRATLGDFCLSGLRRVFAPGRVLQISSHLRRQPTVSLGSINRDLQHYTGRQRCSSSKTKAQSFYRRVPHEPNVRFLRSKLKAINDFVAGCLWWSRKAEQWTLYWFRPNSILLLERLRKRWDGFRSRSFGYDWLIRLLVWAW